jgi:hypothetical protein
MLHRFKFLTLLLLFGPAIAFARGLPNGDSPAFTPVPELSAGFDLLYEQKFAEARQIFASWESRNQEDPFGEVAVAASYLFEELYLQGVLTSDFFLNEKRFLHGIDGRPNPERMSHFGEALTRARELAKVRQKRNPNDGEALFALTLAAGSMEFTETKSSAWNKWPRLPRTVATWDLSPKSSLPLLRAVKSRLPSRKNCFGN